jgi:endonuclease YncB( thermonuclease family)
VVRLLVLGILEAQFNMLSSLTHWECHTTLCCEDCPTIHVSRVIGGDTLDSPAGRVRLFGVDAPERGQPCYAQATPRLRKLAGNSIRVEAGSRETDTAGRLLFYTYTRHGESIEERLIREGLAQAWSQDGQHRDLLVRLERQARTSGSGCLW